MSAMTAVFPSHVTIPEEVLSQELDGEAVLLDLASENYFRLNETGLRIWQLLTENGDPELAFGRLLQEFEIDRQTLRDDMEQLLSQLLEEGLLRLSSNDATTTTR